MTKTERWYAIVEELRAVSPRPRSARWLAERFEVSKRTVERDLDGLLQAGVPLFATPGRTGGWVLDPAATFRTPALDSAEVIALAVAVISLAGTPFESAGRAAMRKIGGGFSVAEASRVGFFARHTPSVPQTVQRALHEGKVLHLEYADAAGAVTSRDVEPIGFLGGDRWFLIGWCRLRDAVRGFRMDRIRAATALDEVAPARGIDLRAAAAGYDVDLLSVSGNVDSTVSHQPS